MWSNSVATLSLSVDAETSASAYVEQTEKRTFFNSSGVDGTSPACMYGVMYFLGDW